MPVRVTVFLPLITSWQVWHWPEAPEDPRAICPPRPPWRNSVSAKEQRLFHQHQRCPKQEWFVTLENGIVAEHIAGTTAARTGVPRHAH
jgi:hypothetical protein